MANNAEVLSHDYLCTQHFYVMALPMPGNTGRNTTSRPRAAQAFLSTFSYSGEFTFRYKHRYIKFKSVPRQRRVENMEDAKSEQSVTKMTGLQKQDWKQPWGQYKPEGPCLSVLPSGLVDTMEVKGRKDFPGKRNLTISIFRWWVTITSGSLSDLYSITKMWPRVILRASLFAI